MVTVADTTAAVIPDAKVTVVVLDEAGKGAPIPPVQTSREGVAPFTGLAPGRYSIVAEFAGFEMGLLRDVRAGASFGLKLSDDQLEGLSADSRCDIRCS